MGYRCDVLIYYFLLAGSIEFLTGKMEQLISLFLPFKIVHKPEYHQKCLHTNNISRQFWFKHFLHICPHLHVISSTSCAQIIYTCYLTGKPNRFMAAD